MFVKARSSHVEVIARNRPALMCSASGAYSATVGVLTGEALVIHLQCGRDVVSGTVNVTVCLHSAHPANTWCSALTNSRSILR